MDYLYDCTTPPSYVHDAHILHLDYCLCQLISNQYYYYHPDSFTLITCRMIAHAPTQSQLPETMSTAGDCVQYDLGIHS